MHKSDNSCCWYLLTKHKKEIKSVMILRMLPASIAKKKPDKASSHLTINIQFNTDLIVISNIIS